MTINNIPSAEKILKGEQLYDLVVIGPKFNAKDIARIQYPELFVIDKPEDIKLLFEKYSPQIITADKPRKLKPLEADINYADAQGKVLLITTNKTIVKELSCFNLKVATNIHSAKRLIHNNGFKLIITDIGLKPKTNLPIYKWGVDVLGKKDVYLLLTTGRLSLETLES